VKSVKAEFDRRGVTIVVISFAEPEKLAPYQERHQWPFIMLADPKRIAYQAFGLKRLSWFRVFAASTLRLTSAVAKVRTAELRQGRLL
jgi:peroxiredoxin